MPHQSLDGGSVWRIDTFVVPPGGTLAGSVVLEGAEGHHAADVIRVRRGQTVRLIDGDGGEALGLVSELGRSAVTVEIAEARSHSRDDGFRLHLAQGLLKGRAFEEVVRRCSELGVESITPLETARTVGRVPQGAEAARLERWRAVAVAAVKQSRGVFIPVVRPVTALEDLDADPTLYRVRAVAWEEERNTGLVDMLRAAAKATSGLVVVGPEGGLDVSEVDLLKARGLAPVSVGRRVLRADWASAAIAAVVSAEYGGLLA